MKRLVPAIALILALLGSLIWADRAFAEKRVALVIGNSAYQHAPALANPARDAKAMAAMFERGGFNVVIAQHDVGNLQFKRTIRQFEDAAMEADIAVIYYAGHGIEIHGVNYLIPVDARLASDRDADDEAITLDRVVEAADGAKRLRLVILDACRDNPFARTMKRQRTATLRGVTAGLGKVEPAGTNTLIAFAAKGGASAEDGDADHSPFTAALLDNLFTPGLDVRLAFGRARDEVLKNTNNRQEPYVYGSLGGANVSIVPAPTQQPDASASAAVSEGAKGDYALVEKIGTKGAWEVFLSQHPKGFYADLARQQLARLGNATSDVPKAPLTDTSINIETREVAQQTTSTARLALVIGNATYAANNKPLTEPLNDARVFADDLRRAGFDVTIAEDLPKEQMRTVFDSFKRKIKPSATVLFFFSGYGLQAAKQSYLIPVDARIQSEDQISRDGLSIESILSEVHAAGATRKLVVIDAARRNSFEPRFRDAPAGLASPKVPTGTLAIYSASPDKVVEETSGDGSLFIAALLKQMRSAGLTAEEIFQRTKKDVSRASYGGQVPAVWNALEQDFLFAEASKVATRDLAAQHRSEARVALVIGNGNYANDTKPLVDPVKDARAVADQLRQSGFDVVSGENLSKAKMRFALAMFKDKIEPGSAALLFFSGYGLQMDKQSYLIPVNAQIKAEDEIEREGLNLDAILSGMNAAGASVKLVIIDAARRNPFESVFRDHLAGLAPLNAPAGTLAIYSAAPYKISSEANDGSSIFLTELLKELRTPGLSAEEIFNRTSEGVMRISRNEQIPLVSSSLTQAFYFAGPSKPQSAAPEGPNTVAIPPPQIRSSAASRPEKTTSFRQANPPVQAKRSETKSLHPAPPNTSMWWWPQRHRETYQ